MDRYCPPTCRITGLHRHIPAGLAGIGGIKHDSEKLRLDLLPVDVLEGFARILTHGARKYGDRNWEAGITYSRLYGATLRHLLAFWRGEDLDPESGMPHIDHAMCELAFLSAMSKRRKDLDDRPLEARQVPVPKKEGEGL